MKAYTDLEQSKKLAEMLPLESADMIYMPIMDIDSMCNSGFFNIPECYPFNEFKDSDTKPLPCWSLAALLDILAKQDFIIKSSERNDEYKYNIDIPIRHCKIWFSSLLDAAFEMVCWLKENNEI